MSERPSVENDAGVVYVVHGPKGFTETFDLHTINVLLRLGLIEHERDGHVLEDGRGRGVGALHRFYGPSVTPPGSSDQ